MPHDDPWDWSHGNFDPPSNPGEAGPRMGAVTSDRRQGGPIIVLPRKSPGQFRPLPRGPWPDDPPPTPILPRPRADLNPDAAQRTLTAHGADGVVPVIFGTLPVGGKIIFGPQESNGFVYMDLLIGRGTVEAIEALEATKPFAELGMVQGTHYNIHLGVAGDTTDAIIQEVEPGYVVPDWWLARVSAKFPLQNQTTGSYNPLDFKCLLKALLCFDFRTGLYTTTATRNPILHIYEALTNTRWGMGDTVPAETLPFWIAAADLCDVDVDPGAGVIKRWESCLMFNRDEEWRQALEVMRAQCFAHMTYDEGWKPFVDASRSSTGVVLRDLNADTSLINCERFDVEDAGVEEVPTVLRLMFTNEDEGYRDDWVQYPDPFPGGEWREHVVRTAGIMTRERARRAARQWFKKLQHDLRARTEMLQLGFKMEPLDRVGAVSTRLHPTDQMELQFSDLKEIEDRGVWAAALETYDPDDYDDAVNTSAPPGAPDPPDPSATPADPTGVVAPYNNELDYGYLEWFPSASPFIHHYEIFDLYGDPAQPALVKTVDKRTPLQADGKYRVFVSEALHGDAAHGRSFRVRLRAVTEWPKWSPGVVASWVIGSVLQPRVKSIYGRAVTFDKKSYTPTGGWSTVRGASAADVKIVDTIIVRDHKQFPVGGETEWALDRVLIAWALNSGALLAQGLTVFPSDATIKRIEVELSLTSAGGPVTAHLCDALEYGGLAYPFDVADYDNVGSSYASLGFVASSPAGYYRWLLYDSITHITGAAGGVDLDGSVDTFFSVRTANDVNDVEPTLNVLTTNFTASGAAAVSPGPRLIVTYTSATEDAGAGGVGSGPSLAFGEPHMGDGTATTVLDHVPIGGVLLVTDFLGLAVEGVHFTRSGATITWTTDNVPEIGASISATYAYL